MIYNKINLFLARSFALVPSFRLANSFRSRAHRFSSKAFSGIECLTDLPKVRWWSSRTASAAAFADESMDESAAAGVDEEESAAAGVDEEWVEATLKGSEVGVESSSAVARVESVIEG